MLRALKRQRSTGSPRNPTTRGKMGALLAEHFGIAEAELPERLGNHLLRVDIDHARRTTADGSIEFDWWGAGWDTRRRLLACFLSARRLARPGSLSVARSNDAAISLRRSRPFSATARVTSLRQISECVSLNGPGRCADRCPADGYVGAHGMGRGFVRPHSGDQLALSRRFVAAGAAGGYFGDDYGARAPCCSRHDCGAG